MNPGPGDAPDAGPFGSTATETATTAFDISDDAGASAHVNYAAITASHTEIATGSSDAVGPTSLPECNFTFGALQATTESSTFTLTEVAPSSFGAAPSPADLGLQLDGAMSALSLATSNSAAAAISAAVGTGLTFTLHNIGGVTSGSQAEAGFLKAAAMWSSYLGDSVNIRLDVGFQSLGANILGSTSSNSAIVTYSAVKTALTADATSASDATAVASLSSTLSFYTNNNAGTRVLDNDGSVNNTYLDISTANLKALGISTNYAGQAIDNGTTADASITFSSDYTFDFDPSNGITAGTIDFVGVAFHEIGHALGFTSGVDVVDYYSGLGPGAAQNINLNNYAIFDTLDLFKYSANGVRDLSYGGTKYFSINGGATNLALFSTGDYNGDGNQASHWKDNLGLGIMDPTSAPAGQANVVTNLDLQAFDVIGWNLLSTQSAGSVSINDVSVTEGDSGTKTLTFTVTRTGGTSAFTVNYATANGTATTADSDYAATSGTLSFAANENSKTISVTINGDIRFETNETFFVNLSGATGGATISDGQGIGTITNDDANHAPVATLVSSTVTAVAYQSFLVSSFFSASDADNNALTYYLYDNTAGANSGHFEVNGVAQAAQTYVVVDEATLAQTRFVSGVPGSNDELHAVVYDGTTSSNSLEWHVTVPNAGNHAPVVSATSANVTATAGQVFQASSLFSATDSDGDSLTYYLYDNSPAAGSGHFAVNGVTQAAQTFIVVNQAQLAQTTFVAGSSGTTDDLHVVAYDGTASSNSISWNVNVPNAGNHAPVVAATSANVTATAGQSFQVSSLFSATDADNDSLTYYLYDNTPAAGSGHFAINGVTQAAQTFIVVNQAQLAQTTFVAGNTGASDDLIATVHDGTTSGNVVEWHVNVPNAGNHAPVVSATSANVSASAGQVFQASSLVSATDADNDALTYYLYDNTTAAGSGHFEVNGVAQAAQTFIVVNQAQLAQTTFVAGTSGANDDLIATAHDGTVSGNVVEWHVIV